MKRFRVILIGVLFCLAFGACNDDAGGVSDDVGSDDTQEAGTDSGNSDTDGGAVLDSDTNAIASEPGVAGVQEMTPEMPPSDAVYLDPDNATDTAQDGTIAHPFSGFADVAISKDTTYAVKRGTTMNIGELVLTSGVQIMSYGNPEDAHPVLQSTVDPPDGTNIHAIVSGWTGISNVTIRDIAVNCPTATSCIRLGGTALSNTNLNIINVRTEGGIWGIRVFGTDGIAIFNTEVSQVYEDGMFLQANENIEIANCYVHDVNLFWVPPSTPETEAGGDAIQFDSCNHWHVHHNVLDRTNSGNKFCFISNNENQTNGVFEYNHTAGPRTINGGAAVYFHNGDGLIVRYNTILAPAATGVYTHAVNVQLYGNIVAGVDSGFFTSVSANVYNNTFYNVANGVSGGEVTLHNNIFVMQADASPYGGVATVTESNNLFENAEATENSVVGTAAFVDPQNNDFHLAESSDAIDGGLDVGLEADIYGTAIPVGGAPDIGAVEQLLK